jgi:hypothetical protein
VSASEHDRLRHARIKEILYEVSLLTRDARSDFLGTACGGDAELRQEVESLLAYHDVRSREAARSGDAASGSGGAGEARTEAAEPTVDAPPPAIDRPRRCGNKHRP